MKGEYVVSVRVRVRVRVKSSGDEGIVIGRMSGKVYVLLVGGKKEYMDVEELEVLVS